MLRFSFLEVLMLGALFIWVGWGVVPRLVQSSPEVRRSQASLLERKLQRLYDAWLLDGGAHGPQDHRAPLVLTQNLLACFTSAEGVPFGAAPQGLAELPAGAVFENPNTSPSPSRNRLTGLRVESPAAVRFSDELGCVHEGVVLSGHFAAAFDGVRWRVTSAF